MQVEGTIRSEYTGHKGAQLVQQLHLGPVYHHFCLGNSFVLDHVLFHAGIARKIDYSVDRMVLCWLGRPASGVEEAGRLC